MDLYSKKISTYTSRFFILTAEIILVIISYFILFVTPRLVTSTLNSNVYYIKVTLFIFNLIILFRFILTMFIFLKRNIPFSEAFSVTGAFAIYYVGFPLVFMLHPHLFNFFSILGITVFLIGSVLNTLSEYQRMIFKKDPVNRGKIFTQKLFTYIRHVNFLGDILWVLGYALVVDHFSAYIVVLLLIILFVFFNIPKLEQYLTKKYKNSFFEWKKKSWRLLPFIY